MALPAPALDQRTFQDLVDQTKRMIATKCPEWTAHNVSDPGVTLIELFAWMTESLLYSVNQVPERMYVRFLELIGIRLQEARPAAAEVTCYLSAAQPQDTIIKVGTEVATLRTETSPAIIFTTRHDLTISVPRLVDEQLHLADASEAGWRTLDLARLNLVRRDEPIFPELPEAGDGLYLPFANDLSRHVLALVVTCDKGGGEGVNEHHPPLAWSVSTGPQRWAPCVLEADNTHGFNEPSGDIILRLPKMVAAEHNGVTAFWLRCQLTPPDETTGRYQRSPRISSLRAEARGGTVLAYQAVTVNDEELGVSDGRPGQQFTLCNRPLLGRRLTASDDDPAIDHLIVAPPGGPAQDWQEVRDFADSGPDSRHYVLDSRTGTLTFGPALPQPDGLVYSLGAVPPAGSRLRFSRYQYGGGVGGNVPARTITVLKTALPYVSSVVNWERAYGGQDAQDLEDAVARAPAHLRARTHAVTAADYEHLACQVPGIARACCVAPGLQPGAPGDPPPGNVRVAVLPTLHDCAGYLEPERLIFNAAMFERVQQALETRRLVGTSLTVSGPTFVWVAVRATLRLSRWYQAAGPLEVRRRAEEALYRYLNPYTGGPDGTGWPFGRALYLSEIYGLLQGIPGVEFVQGLEVTTSNPGSSQATAVTTVLELPRDGLVCSLRHELTAQMEGGPR